MAEHPPDPRAKQQEQQPRAGSCATRRPSSSPLGAPPQPRYCLTQRAQLLA
jgi:hypothetical protein